MGAQGQRATEDLIDRRETSANNKKRAKKLLQKRLDAGYAPENIRAYDCSGLGMYWLQNLKKVYGYDMSSNSMMGKCAVIGKNALRKGDWVFRIYKSGSNKGKAYHIGYIVDEALNVIEAKGRDDGVVKRGLNASGKSYWNAFGRPEVFKEEIEKSTPAKTSGVAFKRLLKLKSPMMRGDDVIALQEALHAAGFSPGKIDGVFGDKTDAAVRAFQTARRLVVDGIVGEKTTIALGVNGRPIRCLCRKGGACQD